MMTIDELLEKPYWIIDILPKQVPKDSPGQYFAIDDYFRKTQRTQIRQKHTNLVLKLNCYLDISVEDEINPDPESLAEAIQSRYVCILIGDAMIQSDPEDTYVTLYHPDPELLALVEKLAAAEGLFVWKG